MRACLKKRKKGEREEGKGGGEAGRERGREEGREGEKRAVLRVESPPRIKTDEAWKQLDPSNVSTRWHSQPHGLPS